MRPYCGDLFGDADLPDNAVGQVARSFPRDLLRIARQAPTGPWLYTGGLENYAGIVARVSSQHELLGTPPGVLRRVRDPFQLAMAFRRAGLLFPETLASTDGAPSSGDWLLKHCKSSGGLRVQLLNNNDCVAGRGWYFQRRVEGLSIGAVYVAAQGRASFLGASEQLLIALGKRPFQYAGSIGPLRLSENERQAVLDVGRFLAAEFDLRGLFGVDLVLTPDGVWTIEVNPRYTASVEVLERALGFNAVGIQIAACREQRLPVLEECNDRLVGKFVVYSEHPQQITTAMTQALLDRNIGRPWPIVADVPRPATYIDAGQPLLTVFAEAADVASVRQKLSAEQHSVSVALSAS
ncbi:MAG TPA: ATP-grasp domain-containing protein [Pirellulales bacterium]|nr:ATP-grasp domain-containing protein [Pirellulales bacterium]